MPIYTRDNINYGGMLQAALQNKANYLKNRYDRVAQMGKNWGDAVANSGKIAQDAMFKIAGNYYDQDKTAQQQQFQATEAEKRALEAMERQKEQQLFQEQQNALNRQNTMDIAKLNKEIAIEDKKDEYQLRYQKAKANLDLIGAQYKDDPSNIQLKKAYEDAKFDLDYWAKKAGANVATTQPTTATPEFNEQFLNEVNAASDFTNAEIEKQLNELVKTKTWDNATRSKANELAKQLPEGMRELWLIRIKELGSTVEDRKALRAKTIANWKPGMPIPAGFKLVYKAGKATIQ